MTTESSDCIKMLFLPNWKVSQLPEDNADIQAPDKHVLAEQYWFFKHFNSPVKVDVIDFQQNNLFSFVEKKCNTYIWQGMKAFWADKHYDVVISHGAQSGLMYSLLRTIFLRRKPVHIIFDIGSMNGARKNKLENRLIQWMLRSKPFIICHSKIIIENYKTSYQNLVERSRFIPFGVDIDDFKLQAPALDTNYILSFGASKRDYKTLLEAWSSIKTTHKLRLIGYQQQCSAANVEVIKRVSIAELRTHIANALFVVIPLPVFNYSYGQMSFLQSMSMGRPVIVTRTPSSVDYLQDGKGAFLVNPYDAADMKAKLEHLLNNQQLCLEMGQQACQFVAENFSEKKMAEQIERFIQEILAISNHRLSNAIT